MTTPNSNYTLSIRKRPWWHWLVAVVWLALVLFFLNTAVASAAELEPQAATINYVVTALLLALGVAGYHWERSKAK
jgi:hypothetical protein